MLRKTLPGALLILAGAVIIALSTQPVQFEETTCSLQGSASSPSAGPLAERSVQLRLPADLPSGDAVLLEMTLLPPAATRAPTSGSSNLLEGRLDLPGAEVFPAPAVTAPFLPGQAVDFRWLVTAGNEAPLPGRIWLTVISTDFAGNETRSPVLAHPLELDVHRLLGLTLPQARGLGAGIAVAGLIALAWQWRERLVRRSKARARKSAQIG